MSMQKFRASFANLTGDLLIRPTPESTMMINSAVPS
jgi:hypothetical protein